MIRDSFFMPVYGIHLSLEYLLTSISIKEKKQTE
jgi:hypothetical protein